MATSLSKNYLRQLEQKLAKWKPARDIQIIRKTLLAEVNAGYIYARVRMQNGDLLELSEYVTAETSELRVNSYNYHWQDASGQFKKRWDNASYHPQIATHPFHLHESTKQNITESEPMTLQKVLKMIENELRKQDKKK